MEIILAIVLTIVLFFIWPFISFGLGMLCGQIIKVTIGGFIISGLKLIGLDVDLTNLPLLFGTIAIIAAFFKSPTINKSKSDF